MGRITDGTDVHTLNEQGCRKDTCVGGEFDQKVKSVAIDDIVGFQCIQCLTYVKHTRDYL
jgi:hypothetical protein